MDKVKQYLIVARKHHFWILCGVAALIGLIVWTSATGKLSAQFKTWKADIDKQVPELQQITANSPNPTWMEGIEKATAEERENVRAAWTTLYDTEARDIYKWPATLGKDFHAEIAKVEEGKKTDLAPNLRELYQKLVGEFAKQLPKIVDSQVAPDQATGQGAVAPMPMRDANGNEIIPDHKVVWDPQAQQEIFDTYYWIESPSTTIVRQAQEELWVYESLCKVIAEVNKNATGSHDASITGIQQLAIAYLAQEGAGGNSGTTHQVMRVKGPATGDGGVGGEMRSMAPPGGEPGAAAGAPPDPKQRCKGAAAGGGMTRGAMGAPAADPTAGGNPDDMWKGFRYVGEDGKPFATAAELDASPLEFNLMPFRMKLSINPKDIDRLLVAFRNTEGIAPLEVKVLRLGDVAGSGGSFMGGGGAARPMMNFGGGGGGRGRGIDGEGGGMNMGARPPAMAAAVPGAPVQKTVQIEVSGVAYLFKKPDPAKLGITPSADGAGPADGAPAAAPMGGAPQAGIDSPMRQRLAVNSLRAACLGVETLEAGSVFTLRSPSPGPSPFDKPGEKLECRFFMAS